MQRGHHPPIHGKKKSVSRRACLAISGLKRAFVGPSTQYSDAIGVDARIVKGVFPQAHMKGMKASMLCLYDRKAKRAEVQEFR
jgi:hypothetical protein